MLNWESAYKFSAIKNKPNFLSGRPMIRHILVISCTLFILSPLQAQSRTYPLSSLDGLEFHNTKTEVVEYQGKTCIQVTQKDGYVSGQNLETLVILPGTDFTNGTIEIELAGEPAPGMIDFARGFVGIGFRVKRTEPITYESIYIRPTNGRADDQLRRNHSVQYISHPDFPWHRLRSESPGLYETYLDCEPGKWTKLKIVVKENKAALYVHDNDQPTLIVNDLKLGKTGGEVALWIDASTLAHFRNLVITPGE